MTVDTGKGVAGYPATPTSPRKSTGLLARRRGRIGLWFVMPWVVGFLLWYAIPMVASLWFSFTDFNLVSNEPTQYIGLENWQRLFIDPAVRQSAWNTMVFGAIALPVAIFFPMFLAYLLVSKALRAREGFRALFFLPSIIP
ncbi:MAG TPA: sugar ABC transporter permease, partial [Acidimicrobiia bacterium]